LPRHYPHRYQIGQRQGLHYNHFRAFRASRTLTNQSIALSYLAKNALNPPSRAKLYPSGSLNFEYEFSEPGKFVGLVTVGAQEKIVSRFPFSVGRSHGWLGYLVLSLLIAALAAGLYRVAVVRRRLVKPGALS
jgi:hypothetical protein